MSTVLRLLLINVRNTLILLILIFLSIPPISAVSKFVTQSFFDDEDPRARLINYKNVPWAAEHFREFNELETDYLGYVVWRRKPYSGSTILIDPKERIRVTPSISGLSARSTYFFGGSTMWGSGATNETTIPAYYQTISRETAVNYAETGWTAHQNINQLMKLAVEGRKPANVVFYDGANEVAHKCRAENSFYSHSNEAQIRDALEYRPKEFGYYARPLVAATESLAETLGLKQKNAKFFDCDTNPEKANLVAEALIVDWRTARQISELNGSRFFAFLQPIAYLGTSPISHLRLDEDLGRQFRAVYPLIRAKMKERGIGIDLSNILDRNEIYFIDFCHVSPNGNEVIAREMQRVIGGAHADAGLPATEPASTNKATQP